MKQQDTKKGTKTLTIDKFVLINQNVEFEHKEQSFPLVKFQDELSYILDELSELYPDMEPKTSVLTLEEGIDKFGVFTKEDKNFPLYLVK